MFDLEQHLLKVGPCLSSFAAKQLHQKSGLSAEAARQRVSRTRDPVRRLPELLFPRNARLLYHESTYNSAKYWDGILAHIGQASPAYDAAVHGLRSRGGIVPVEQFHSVCGAPHRQRKQLCSDAVLTRFRKIGLVELREVKGLGECVAFSARVPLPCISDQEARARQIAENIVLSAVDAWAGRLGLASHASIRRRGADVPPQVGTVRWDLTGPSYVLGLRRIDEGGRPKPGFLVGDVALGTSIGIDAVSAFVRKCGFIRSTPNVGALFPMFIADHFEPAAFKLGRSHGVLLATTENLFGAEVAQALRALIQTLMHAAATAVARPEVVDQLFGALGKIEGAASNLRGALFELIVGHCVKKLDGGHIDIGKVFTTEDGERAEVDVLRLRDNGEAWSYECKGYGPSQVVDEDEVEVWLSKKVPRIYKALRDVPGSPHTEMFFEFWTSGEFSKDAVKLLRSAQKRTTTYSVGWKCGEDIRRYASRLRPRSVANMLDTHFLRHPIAVQKRKSRRSTVGRNPPPPAARSSDAERNDATSSTGESVPF